MCEQNRLDNYDRTSKITWNIINKLIIHLLKNINQ